MMVLGSSSTKRVACGSRFVGHLLVQGVAFVGLFLVRLGVNYVVMLFENGATNVGISVLFKELLVLMFERLGSTSILLVFDRVVLVRVS